MAHGNDEIFISTSAAGRHCGFSFLKCPCYFCALFWCHAEVKLCGVVVLPFG